MFASTSPWYFAWLLVVYAIVLIALGLLDEEFRQMLLYLPVSASKNHTCTVEPVHLEFPSGLVNALHNLRQSFTRISW